jgi:quinol monooxygenase YgiN
MYGLLSKFKTAPGKRDELTALMLPKPGEVLPGCLSFIIANDPGDADLIWITEVWESMAAHKASLELPQVKQSIAKGMPLIVDFVMHVETDVVGGIGLGGSK